MSITAMLIAVGVLIPMYSPVKIMLSRCRLRWFAHRDHDRHVRFSAQRAGRCAGTTAGFLSGGFTLPVVLRAHHVVWAYAGALYLKKHPDLFQSPAKTFVFNLAVAIVHAVLEVIIVMPLYTGYDASQLFYLLFVLVGVGSVVHSTVDFVLSLAVWKAVTASAAIRAVAVIKHIGFSESRK
ncbi:MAG: hypothetical protein ACLTCB_03090 [Merdibacter sp.]